MTLISIHHRIIGQQQLTCQYPPPPAIMKAFSDTPNKCSSCVPTSAAITRITNTASTALVAIAKAGIEDGHALIGGSVIVNPDGIIVAETNSDADELIVHSCNLDDCLFGKQSRFDFCRHRRIENYRLITEQTGVVRPLGCD